jgi:hypothetical protein
MARSRRTPATLVGRCLWELSGRKLRRKIKRSQIRSEADLSQPAPSEPWGVPWRDLQFRGPSLERFFDCVIPALISLENIFYTQKRAAISPPVGDALRHRSNR